MNTWNVFAIALCLCACGKTSDDPMVGNPSGDAGSADQACGAAISVPVQHRALPEQCKAARGSIGPVNTAACTDTRGLVCKSDADCTAGSNGRCLLNGAPCLTLCSYDECLADADCPEKQPCGCRSSATDTFPNQCVKGSSCATDADCGKCGFCSLSVQPTVRQCENGDAGIQCACIGVTSEAYACHTAQDECTNDTDCPAQDGYCAFMDAKTHWACGTCPTHQIL